jgi:phosphate transport system protein
MDNADLSHHIVSRFNEDLERARSNVLRMGGLVESQLALALRALLEGDVAAGNEVVRCEYDVNALQVSIDDECNRILATRAPTASDLRLVVAIIKTVTDMERIGDEAEKVGYIGSHHSNLDHAPEHYRVMRHLGSVVQDMVRDALDCFARLDAATALAVAKRDRLVDEEYEAVQRQCITFMIEDPRTIRRAIDLLWIARALERIGDHAKNICEYVIYMVHGKDIRHISLKDVEEQLQAEPRPPAGLSATDRPQ